MRKLQLLLIVTIASIVLPLQGSTRAATVIEKLIAAQNPCAELKTTKFGVTIGIDRLEEVSLGNASANLDGDEISLNFEGRLACRTSNSAVVTGNAAASVSGETTMSLSDCNIANLKVSLSDFSGTFALILETFAPSIEIAIEQAVQPRLTAACKDFRGESQQ